MILRPPGGGKTVTISSEIGISREALANALKTYELSMDSNQRSYAWEKENVLELFQDLHNAIDDSDPEYFLGSIVVTRSEGHVVDGQQRLATTMILLAAMRDYFVEVGDAGRAGDIETKFLFSKNFRTQEPIPRLTLNKRDHDFFKKRVLAKPGMPERNTEPDKNKDSHIRILEAIDVARDRIRQITAPFSAQQRADKIADWIEYLEKRARVIWISVPDDANAYTIFETLNDRGVELSTADLLKVNIFNAADDRLTEAETRWDAMLGALEVVGGEELTKTYIRHLWVAMNGPTRERELLTSIKASLDSTQAAINLSNELAESAKYYSAILNPQHPLWEKNIAAQHLIHDLNVLGVQQMRPLLLAIVRKFQPKETEMALRSLVSWTVRFLIYGGLGGGTLEKHYAIRAKAIWNGNLKTTKELADDLIKNDILPSDAEFLSAFSTARAHGSLARFYLRALDIKAVDGDPCMVPNEDTEVVNLEHVLPQNPSAAWGAIDPETAGAYYKRIGNLAIISTEINNEIGNAGWDAKKPFIAASPFKLTKSIADSATWGIEEIGKRQQELAELAVATWPLRP
jgi:hypothetical protein